MTQHAPPFGSKEAEFESHLLPDLVQGERNLTALCDYARCVKRPWHN